MPRCERRGITEPQELDHRTLNLWRPRTATRPTSENCRQRQRKIRSPFTSRSMRLWIVADITIPRAASRTVGRCLGRRDADLQLSGGRQWRQPRAPAATPDDRKTEEGHQGDRAVTTRHLIVTPGAMEWAQSWIAALPAHHQRAAHAQALVTGQRTVGGVGSGHQLNAGSLRSPGFSVLVLATTLPEASLTVRL